MALALSLTAKGRHRYRQRPFSVLTLRVVAILAICDFIMILVV